MLVKIDGFVKPKLRKIGFPDTEKRLVVRARMGWAVRVDLRAAESLAHRIELGAQIKQ